MKWILFSLVCLGLGYELAALVNSTEGDTISEIVWEISRRPIVPFIFGLVMGHFFWPRYLYDHPHLKKKE